MHKTHCFCVSKVTGYHLLVIPRSAFTLER
jgi:hypothetical protein